jgi:hypothetical protein|tara:strand:- start:8166 stop:8516 length:351 start_codon:yes stop_codon:yes gene_type:complete
MDGDARLVYAAVRGPARVRPPRGVPRAAWTRVAYPRPPRLPTKLTSPPSPKCVFPSFFVLVNACSPFKEGRMEGVHEGKARVKEGTQWREHSIRKFMRTQKPQIFPGLNAAMTKAS